MVTGFAAAVSAFATDTIINVASGDKTFAAALTDNGLEEFPSGTRLVKTGAGRLTDLTTVTIYGPVKQTWVKEGCLQITADVQFGTPTYDAHNIVVDSGATILASGNGLIFNNRCVDIAGSGCGQIGANNFQGAIHVWNNSYATFIQLRLTDDATICNGGQRHAELFAQNGNNVASADLNGHTLTFKSVAPALANRHGLRFNGGFKMKGNGTVVAQGIPFVSRTIGSSFARQNSTDVTLKLANDGQYSASVQAADANFFNLFDCYDFESGAEIDGIDTSGDQLTANQLSVSVKGVAGIGYVGAGIGTLTITDRITARVGDLVGGNWVLSANGGEVVFGQNAELVLEGDLGALMAAGDEFTLVSAVSVIGTPTLSGSASKLYEVQNTGSALVLKYAYEDPEGVINVMKDWGLSAGSEATGNAALFQSKLATLTGGETVYFPPLDFYFECALDLNKAGVTFLGAGDISVIHGAVGVSADNVTITGINIAGTTGAAVTAANVANLTVTNNFFTAVVADYPVVVTGGTGTLVRHNRVTDGAAYTAPVYVDNSTMATGSEPFNGELHIWVDAGEEIDFVPALRETGYADYPTDWRLFKDGPGTLVGTNLYGCAYTTNPVEHYISGVTVAEGVYKVYNYLALGRIRFGANDDVTVKSGATLRFATYAGEGQETGVNNKIVFIEGEGAPGQGGAIVSEKSKAQNMYIQIRLLGDATIANAYAGGYSKFFNYWAVERNDVRFNGHSLTLRAAEGGYPGFELNGRFGKSQAGTLVLDGIDLRQTSDSLTVTDDGAEVTLKLVNYATFTPRNSAATAIFKSYDLEHGTMVDAAEGYTPFAIEAVNVTGCGDFGTGISQLTITGGYNALAADIANEYGLYVGGDLVFGNGSTWCIDDASQVTAGTGRHTLITAASVTGAPVRTGAGGGWIASLTSTALSIVRAGGTMLIFR